jgi:hypothetical protein
VGIVSRHLAFCLGSLLVMCAACFGDLSAPLCFAALVVFLSLAERLVGYLDGSFVSLLAAEYPAETRMGSGSKSVH